MNRGRPLTRVEAFHAILAMAETTVPGPLLEVPRDPEGRRVRMEVLHQPGESPSILRRRPVRPIEVYWRHHGREVVARWDGAVFSLRAIEGTRTDRSGPVTLIDRVDVPRGAMAWLGRRRAAPFGPADPGCGEGDGKGRWIDRRRDDEGPGMTRAFSRRYGDPRRDVGRSARLSAAAS
jgi:hypothetical protein